MRHRIVGTVVYDIPWLADRKDVVGGVLGGWQLSSVLNFRTGEPLRITQASGIGNSRPDYNGGNQVLDNWRDTMQYLDRSAYTLVPTSPTTRATIRPATSASERRPPDKSASSNRPRSSETVSLTRLVPPCVTTMVAPEMIPPVLSWTRRTTWR